MLTGVLRMERRHRPVFRVLPAEQGFYNLLEPFPRHPRHRERLNLASFLVHAILLGSVLTEAVISQKQGIPSQLVQALMIFQDRSHRSLIFEVHFSRFAYFYWGFENS